MKKTYLKLYLLHISVFIYVSTQVEYISSYMPFKLDNLFTAPLIIPTSIISSAFVWPLGLFVSFFSPHSLTDFQSWELSLIFIVPINAYLSYEFLKKKNEGTKSISWKYALCLNIVLNAIMVANVNSNLAFYFSLSV